jgi:4-aminobutyrate aminotransferase-like enzyme
VVICNSGSEAVENAVKLARHATGKGKIIAFQGGYHGRTVGTMSLTTSKTVYSAGFGPLMSGVSFVPYPYHIHGPIHDEGALMSLPIWCCKGSHTAACAHLQRRTRSGASSRSVFASSSSRLRRTPLP